MPTMSDVKLSNLTAKIPIGAAAQLGKDTYIWKGAAWINEKTNQIADSQIAAALNKLDYRSLRMRAAQAGQKILSSEGMKGAAAVILSPNPEAIATAWMAAQAQKHILGPIGDKIKKGGLRAMRGILGGALPTSSKSKDIEKQAPGSAGSPEKGDWVKESTFDTFQNELFERLRSLLGFSEEELDEAQDKIRDQKEAKAEGKRVGGGGVGTASKKGGKRKSGGINWWKVILFGAGGTAATMLGIVGLDKLVKMFEGNQSNVKKSIKSFTNIIEGNLGVPSGDMAKQRADERNAKAKLEADTIGEDTPPETPQQRVQAGRPPPKETGAPPNKIRPDGSLPKGSEYYGAADETQAPRFLGGPLPKETVAAGSPAAAPAGSPAGGGSAAAAAVTAPSAPAGGAAGRVAPKPKIKPKPPKRVEARQPPKKTAGPVSAKKSGDITTPGSLKSMSEGSAFGKINGRDMTAKELKEKEDNDRSGMSDGDIEEEAADLERKLEAKREENEDKYSELWDKLSGTTGVDDPDSHPEMKAFNAAWEKLKKATETKIKKIRALKTKKRIKKEDVEKEKDDWDKDEKDWNTSVNKKSSSITTKKQKIETGGGSTLRTRDVKKDTAETKKIRAKRKELRKARYGRRKELIKENPGVRGADLNDLMKNDEEHSNIQRQLEGEYSTSALSKSKELVSKGSTTVKPGINTDKTTTSIQKNGGAPTVTSIDASSDSRIPNQQQGSGAMGAAQADARRQKTIASQLARGSANHEGSIMKNTIRIAS